MPTVMIWNIELFGLFSDLKKGPMGNRTNGTIWAIAQVINAYGADVVVMQECMSNLGPPQLTTLQTYLNAIGGAWSFDWVPGAVTNPAPPVNGIGDLGYHQTSHRENYAVLWNTGATLLPFNGPPGSSTVKMSFGKDGIAANQGYINLMVEGYAPRFVWNADPPIQAPAGAPLPPIQAARFPPPSCVEVRNLVAGDRISNDTILWWQYSRRPCRIQVQAHADVLHIMVQHGSNGKPTPYYEALSAALSPLFQPSQEKMFVYGGDLNFTNKYELDGARIYLTTPPFKMTNGTAYTAVTVPPTAAEGYRRTQIQYKTPDYLKSFGPLTTHVYEAPRDILFYRGFVPVASGVADVVQGLTTANSAIANALFSPVPGIGGPGPNPLQLSLNDAITMGPAPGPLPIGVGKYCLPQTVRDNLAGYPACLTAPFGMAAGAQRFATLQEAAIFFRCFISDHLPVCIQI